MILPFQRCDECRMARPDAGKSGRDHPAEPATAAYRVTDQRYTLLVLFAKSTVEATTARQ
jgi:hypothetical protein